MCVTYLEYLELTSSSAGIMSTWMLFVHSPEMKHCSAVARFPPNNKIIETINVTVLESILKLIIKFINAVVFQCFWRQVFLTCYHKSTKLFTTEQGWRVLKKQYIVNTLFSKYIFVLFEQFPHIVDHQEITQMELFKLLYSYLIWDWLIKKIIWCLLHCKKEWTIIANIVSIIYSVLVLFNNLLWS